MIKDLDVMKWLCREFWTEVFRKSTDRLQTNNRVRRLASSLLHPTAAIHTSVCVQGVYVLQDFNFRWTKYISGAVGEDNRALVLKFALLPCGLLRGALSALGMDVTVNVDVSHLPKVIFQINLKEEAALPAPA
jgi:hypothetical protein